MVYVSPLCLVLFRFLTSGPRGPSRITGSDPPIMEGKLRLREGKSFARASIGQVDLCLPDSPLLHLVLGPVCCFQRIIKVWEGRHICILCCLLNTHALPREELLEERADMWDVTDHSCHLHSCSCVALTLEQAERNHIQSRKSWASFPGPSRDVGEMIGFLLIHPPGPPALLAARGIEGSM